MRGLKRNMRPLYYQLYSEHIPVYETDLDGNVVTDPVTGEPLLTGDYTVGYGEPVMFLANISANRGNSESDPFGVSLNYTKQISTCDMDLPIDELSIIWEHTPTGKPEEADYTVVAVARSLNSIVYAVNRIAK